MKESVVHESEIQKELNRRLDIVLRDGYQDPARADISRWELVLWFSFAILIAAITAVIRTGV
ncbi:hypothetical protein [Hyphomicrobium facile]|uniref:Uncharacterized protein n=1 Tax=Hyphomicrobium facile TaxID=51670 RepID=A0A1I7MYV2_9HYPH|nr:hypothetical protein [Hyphomicrobium facile]SFV27582.1 hypothetical protein SAMN04488557_0795 [Hyphomicrobium facile]